MTINLSENKLIDYSSINIIHHRINTINRLLKIPLKDGAEIDVRYHNQELVLCHDPFHHPSHQICTLKKWLSTCNLKGKIILNIKTEGIEDACIELMQQFKISNYFFLDLSMPYFVKYTQKAKDFNSTWFNPSNLAVRFSDEEPLEYALQFKGKANWIWIDFFSSFPLNSKILNTILDCNFKICLVSPELQQKPLEHIKKIKNFFKKHNIMPQAVCTKHPDLWLSS